MGGRHPGNETGSTTRRDEPDGGGRADMSQTDKHPQTQICEFCKLEQELCHEISVTIASDNRIFGVGESYWVCDLCVSRPISDLISLAYGDQ